MASQHAPGTYPSAPSFSPIVAPRSTSTSATAPTPPPWSLLSRRMTTPCCVDFQFAKTGSFTNETDWIKAGQDAAADGRARLAKVRAAVDEGPLGAELA